MVPTYRGAAKPCISGLNSELDLNMLLPSDHLERQETPRRRGVLYKLGIVHTSGIRVAGGCQLQIHDNTSLKAC
jgi:hypothetical protein